MTSIAHLSVRILRTALLSTAVTVTAGVTDAIAQALIPKAPSSSPSVSLPLGPPIRQIVVAGTQRIEPATVLSYISVREGDQYDEQAVDRSLKTLFATGLFADVKFRWNGQTLTIQVV
jgi:outer membrane protein insertion porin family